MRQLEDAVDIVHRIGRKEDNRSRPVMVMFAEADQGGDLAQQQGFPGLLGEGHPLLGDFADGGQVGEEEAVAADGAGST